MRKKKDNTQIKGQLVYLVVIAFHG